jgi:hypothetical protein
MVGYFLYFVLVVGLSVLLTASFRRLRGDGGEATLPEEDAAFDRRIAAIEKRFGDDSNGSQARRLQDTSDDKEIPHED